MDPVDFQWFQAFSPFDRILQLVKEDVSFDPSGRSVVTIRPKGETDPVEVGLTSAYLNNKDADIRRLHPSFTIEKQVDLLLRPKEVSITIEINGTDATKAVKRIEMLVKNDMATAEPYVWVKEGKEQGSLSLSSGGEDVDLGWPYPKPKGWYAVEATHTTNFQAALESQQPSGIGSLRPLFQYVVVNRQLDDRVLHCEVRGPSNYFFVQKSDTLWVPKNPLVKGCTLDPFTVVSLAGEDYTPVNKEDYHTKIVPPEIENPLRWPVVFKLIHNGELVGYYAGPVQRASYVMGNVRRFLTAETVRRMWVLAALLESTLYSDNLHSVTHSWNNSYVRQESGGYLVSVDVRIVRETQLEAINLSDYRSLLDPDNTAGKWLLDLQIDEDGESLRYNKDRLYSASDVMNANFMMTKAVLVSYVTELGKKRSSQATFCSSIECFVSDYRANGGIADKNVWKRGTLEKKPLGETLTSIFEEVDSQEGDKPTLLTQKYSDGTLFIATLGQHSFITRSVRGENRTYMQIVYDPRTPLVLAGNFLEDRPGAVYSIRSVKGYVSQVVDTESGMKLLSREYGKGVSAVTSCEVNENA